MWLRVSIIFLCTIGSAAAQPRTLIISGGGSPESNFRSFTNIVNLAFGTESARGRDPVALSSDGSLKLAGGKSALPALTIQDIEGQLESLGKSFSGKSDSLTIFMGDHGDAPTSSDPLSGGIILYSKGGTVGKPSKAPRVSYAELQELIRKHIPSKVTVRLVGMQCYSGGLHSISFKLSNVCSSSNTDWKWTASGGIDGDTGLPKFHRVFWETIRRDSPPGRSPTSLAEAHQKGFDGDRDNEKRGQLSSMAFVDSVLREGAYAESSVSPTQEAVSLVKGFGRTLDEKTLFECRNPGVLFAELEALADSVKKALFAAQGGLSRLEGVPEPLRGRIQAASKDWSKNRGRYLAQIQAYQARYQKLRKELATPGGEEETKIVVYTELFSQMEREGTETLNSFFNTYSALRDGEKIGRFFKVASPEQKRTFGRLLKCESEAM